MATPIFIVEWRRSGTTWLGNLISQNNNVASVMTNSSFIKDIGVYESLYFVRLAGKFGDLKNYNNLIHFVDFFCSSDFCLSTGIDKEIIYNERPKTYEELFRIVMDRFAQKMNVEFWLEKSPSHSFHVDEISHYYVDAKFIAIKRDKIGQLGSAMKMNGLLLNPTFALFSS